MLRDGTSQGINYNRFMVTDRSIYLGELTDSVSKTSAQRPCVFCPVSSKQLRYSWLHSANADLCVCERCKEPAQLFSSASSPNAELR